MDRPASLFAQALYSESGIRFWFAVLVLLALLLIGVDVRVFGP